MKFSLFVLFLAFLSWGGSSLLALAGPPPLPPWDGPDDPDMRIGQYHFPAPATGSSPRPLHIGRPHNELAASMLNMPSAVRLMDDGTYGEFDYFWAGVPLRMLDGENVLTQLAPFINSNDHRLLETFRLEPNHRNQFDIASLSLTILTTAYFEARARAENAQVNIPLALQELHMGFEDAHRNWQIEVRHTVDFFTPQFQVWFSPSAMRARWVRIVRLISLYNALEIVDNIRREVPLPPALQSSRLCRHPYHRHHSSRRHHTKALPSLGLPASPRVAWNDSRHHSASDPRSDHQPPPPVPRFLRRQWESTSHQPPHVDAASRTRT